MKLCFLDLNLPCFQSWGPSWKIFKEKMLSSENIKCLNMMPKHFLFPWPKSKIFWWISIKKNAEKREKIGNQVISESKQEGIVCLLTKLFIYDSRTIFVFNVQNLLFLIFQGGPRGPKHYKFKSKKQKFLDFNFFMHEAYLRTS